MLRAVHLRWESGLATCVPELAPVVAPFHIPGARPRPRVPVDPPRPRWPGGPRSLSWRRHSRRVAVVDLWRRDDSPPIHLPMRWGGAIPVGGGSGSQGAVRKKGGGGQNASGDIWRPPKMSPWSVDRMRRHLKEPIATHTFHNNIPYLHSQEFPVTVLYMFSDFLVFFFMIFFPYSVHVALYPYISGLFYFSSK